MRGEREKVLKDEECIGIIRQKLCENSMNDYVVVAYKVVPLDEINGFMGQYLTLKATVACSKNSKTTRRINFFIKLLPPLGSPQHEMIMRHGSFDKEVSIYESLFPKLLDCYNYVPQCFLSSKNNVIVLEDMSNQGFVMPNKYVPFDFEHCAIVMKTLAQFHGRSLIFEKRYQKNINDEFSVCTKECLWPLKDSKARLMFDISVNGILTIIDMVQVFNNEEKKLFKKKLIELSIDHPKKLGASDKHKNVLCHGDLWANNILFEYDGEKKPTKCCLIDFQLARYTPPAHDILCFMYFTATRETRQKHEETLLKIYHNEIKNEITRADLNIDDVLPWDDFLRSIEALRTTCMIHGVLNVPIMLLESRAVTKFFGKEPDALDKALYVDRAPLICPQFQHIPQYRERMLELLLELYDHFFITRD